MRNDDSKINERLKKEIEICRQTENFLRNLQSNDSALAKELRIQYKASKEVQNFFKKDGNEWNGDYVDDRNSQEIDPREFLYQQMYLLKETNIKLKLKLKNVTCLQDTVECFEKLRRNKQTLIFLNEMLVENCFGFVKNVSSFSYPRKCLFSRLFLRVIGCTNVSRSFTLRSILIGLPCTIKKSMKTVSLTEEDGNINAKIRCDFLVDGKVIFSTMSREPSPQCWNTKFDFVHDLSKPLEIQVVWESPYKQLSNVIKKHALHYKSLDFVIGAHSYLFLDEDIDHGFLTRSIDLYPEGRILIETVLKPISKSKGVNGTLPRRSDATDNSSRYLNNFTPSPISGFKICALLGTGCFGKIVLCQQLSDRKYYALKIIKKQSIIESCEYEQIYTEKVVLEVINEKKHPLMVHLFSCIQDRSHIMFVLEFIQAGDLVTLIHDMGTFSDEQILFYVASVTLCIEFLHRNNIMYRDLKMENILLDQRGYVKLVDFGLCKLNMDKESRTSTFCGTVDYLAPEVACGKSYSRMVDWWALGVLTYYMLTGEVPFYAENEADTLNYIIYKPISIPSAVDAITSSFIISLLNRSPKSRLGAKNGAIEVKIHPYFKNVDFHKIFQKTFPAPFIPNLKNELDLSFFDHQFTMQKPSLSGSEIDITNNEDAKLFFENFS